MANGLYAKEAKIKELIEKDRTDPAIYYAIKDLALGYLKRYKKMPWGHEAEEVATLIAEDLYMSVYKGNTIYMWIGFIARACMGYIRQFRYMTGTEFIDTTDDPLLEEAVVGMCTNGSYELASGKEYRQLENIESLSILADVIVGVMDRSRYRRYTPEYCNSHISILLSILKGTKIAFQLDEAESMYLSILLGDVSDKARDMIIAMNTEQLLFSGGSMMALFSLSQLPTDTSEGE